MPPLLELGPPLRFIPEVGEKGHTGLFRKPDQKIHRKGELHERQRIKAVGNPPIVSCDSIYPKHVMNDPRGMGLNLKQTSE